jgi:hypothetical protein
VALVCADRFASIVIVFEHGIMLKARVGCGKRKSARTRE